MKCLFWTLFLALAFASKRRGSRKAASKLASTEAMEPSSLQIKTASVPVSQKSGARSLVARGIGNVGRAMYMDKKPEFALALQDGDFNCAIRSFMTMYVRRMSKIAFAANISRLTSGTSADPRIFLLVLLLDTYINLQQLLFGGDEYWQAATLPVHKLFVILWRLEGLPFFLCFTLFPEAFPQTWPYMLFFDIFWSLSYENSFALENRVGGFRDEKVKKEQAEGRLEFRIVLNDGSPESFLILTGLKSLFQKQLPKMPKEYIARLVYDLKHESLAILRLPLTASSVIGGITYRLFKDRGFCEIVFCAVSSSEQVKGFGSALMSQLKEKIKERTGGAVHHFLTYADNYAIGYFKKQGFYKQISLDRSVWAGYIKDYDGGTLMQCTMVPNVDYLSVYPMLHQQKVSLVRAIEAACPMSKVHPGLPADAFPLASPTQIPGVLESGWNEDLSRLTDIPRRSKLYETLRPILNDLQAHPAAWPFLEPVDPQEVPAYYQSIQNPMDLSTMDSKLESEQYGDVKAFADDLFLVVKNCRSFNDPDTTYYKNANSLEKFFLEKLRSKDLSIDSKILIV